MSAGEAPFPLERYLQLRRRDVEAALASVSLDEFPERLRQPIEYAIGVGGKRLRPVLCVTAYQAVAKGAEPGPDVYRAAAAIELIHAYSLVHDDLPFMDDDDMRRGRPTAHRVFGSATATVAGAAMIVLAFRVLDDALERIGAPAGARRDAIELLAAAAGAAGMVGGQWLDLAAEGQPLARPELERVHAFKTGALIRAAVVLGGILAGASAPQREGLATYGAALGLAFQIADDLLDARGDSADIGKTAGRDAALAKSTYPGLLGIDNAESLARNQVEIAVRTLDDVSLRSPELEALARYAVERRS